MAHKQAADFVVERVLGIDVNERYAQLPLDLDQRARNVIDPADTYLEDEPSVTEIFKELVPTRDGAVHYVTELFPSASWIRRYNVRWLAGDVLAGNGPRHIILCPLLTFKPRHHYWPRRCTPSPGIRGPCALICCLWLIHLLYRCCSVLDVWNLQRHCHWCK